MTKDVLSDEFLRGLDNAVNNWLPFKDPELMVPDSLFDAAYAFHIIALPLSKLLKAHLAYQATDKTSEPFITTAANLLAEIGRDLE